MNLIDDPWIPVRWHSGGRSLASLEEAFRRADEIADVDAAPHERISVMRLLVCILQAAVGAPEDPESWEGYGDDLAIAVPAYLRQVTIFPHFEMLGNGPRFLQVPVSKSKTPVPSSKIFPRLATGNNPTNFDHSGGSERAFDTACLALGLLTFQNFYPLYGAGYKGRGPCCAANMVHTMLIGENLRETMVLNALDVSTIQSTGAEMGRPLWECAPLQEKKSVMTYLGRLVPRHRDLWLSDDGSHFNISNKSMIYPAFPEFREASATIILKKKGTETGLLSARLSRAVWRDLDLVTSLGKMHGHFTAAPLVFGSHFEALEAGAISFWSGALITDLKAKILDTVESVFTVPHAMFSETGRTIYRAGIEYANTWEKALWVAATQYAATLKQDAAPTEEAKRHFWHCLDQQRKILLDFVDTDELADFSLPENSWSQAVRRAAYSSYHHTCPATSPSPRLIHAHVEGLRRLKPKSSTAKARQKSNNILPTRTEHPLP